MLAPYIGAVLAGAIMGVALEDVFALGTWLALSLLVSTGSLVVLALSVGVARARITMVVIGMLFGVVCGSIRMDMHSAHQEYLKAQLRSAVQTEVHLVGRIVQEPDVRASYTNLTIETEVGTRVLVRDTPYSPVVYGDTVTVQGVLEEPTSFTTATDKVFDYAEYLALSDTHYVIERPMVSLVARGDRSLLGALYQLKEHYILGLQRTLSEPEAGLGAGITVGYKAGLGKELQQTFRDVGLVHIVVLSGFNITIIIVFLLHILGRVPWVPRHILVVVVIGLFTLMAGADAPIVRAALMGSIGVFALTTGKQYAVGRALLLVIVGMVLWSPRMLLHDVAFQLSVVATFGIVYFQPLVKSRLHALYIRSVMLGDIVSTTLATQIAVLPLLMYHMGEVSIIGILANILVLPTVPVAMLGAFVTGIVSMLSPVLALPLAWGTYTVLHYIVATAKLLGAVPFAVLTL